MKWIYLLTPFWAWLLTGLTKFVINSIKSRQWAVHQIGYGGMPSNHSAIVSAVAMQIALQAGVQNPAFGAAMGLVFIVVLDAKALRGQLGKHAARINKLSPQEPGKALRERMGHTVTEIVAGVLVGSISACLLSMMMSL
jgi:uncharacterized protein